ncbi:MAG: hypothetical protein AB1830_05790 [Pseudomonadota bacterium]
MRGGGAFAYAQARLQARHGQRAGDPVFQSLAPIAEFRPYLERARLTPLKPWMLNIGAGSDPHEIERLLRAHLRARIEEAAAWVPAAWRAPVRWTQVLVDLPALEYLLRGEPALPWMMEEDSLKALALAEPEARRAVLGQGDYGPLAQGADRESLLERWLRAWRSLLPRMPNRAARRLEGLVVLVRDHRAAFAPAPSGESPSPRAAWDARRRLEAQAARHFRRAFLEPAAVFAHLLLLALEFERLRGALVTRRLFASEGG